MNSQTFDHIVAKRLELIKSILIKKRAEYAPDGGDRLHNFNRAAAMLKQTRERALMGMLSKHLVSLLDMVDGFDNKKMPSFALIEEKIGDAVNYLILLEAMMKEDVMATYPVLKECGNAKKIRL